MKTAFVFQVKTTKPGYLDLSLKYREIPDPDDCSRNPCPEGSACVDGQFSYTCKCDSDSCDPCLNARCMTFGFCLYDDHAGPCTCSDTSLEIPSCTGNNYSKYFLTQHVCADLFALKFLMKNLICPSPIKVDLRSKVLRVQRLRQWY